MTLPFAAAQPRDVVDEELDAFVASIGSKSLIEAMPEAACLVRPRGLVLLHANESLCTLLGATRARPARRPRPSCTPGF